MKSSHLYILLLFIGWLAGCQEQTVPPFPTPILPSATAVSSPLTPTTSTATPLPTDTMTTPSPDTGWELLRPGLERRKITLFDTAGQPTEALYLLRIEPSQFQFGIVYHPGKPQTLADWQQETGALLVVNGGYFTPEYVATGLIVVDGQASGSSYQGFGGMLAITADGPQVRGLAERPFDPQEPLVYALQSFPLLVQGGGVGYEQEDGQASRRTVIGQDENGRILFLLAPWGSFTLHELSTYLVASDLQLTIALNLDGGTSTGLLLAEPTEEVMSFLPLPTVITVHPR